MTPYIIVGILIIVFGLIYCALTNLFFGRTIEVNISKGRIYGWYNGEILVSKSFSLSMATEDINRIKEEVSKELDKNIEKYKKIK